MTHLDETHDATHRSWVASANAPGADFPVQNLPLGVFRRADHPDEWRQGIAIGDQILDLVAAAEAGSLGEVGDLGFHGPLNSLMARDPDTWDALRVAASRLLRDSTEEGRRAAQQGNRLLVSQAEATMRVPADIGDYTDFYASVYHATNVGSMFRPDNPLLPNYKWVPIGYHGRASSIVVSDTPVRRPLGQSSANPAGPPAFGPSRRLDYEVELGAWIGGGNTLGTPVPLSRAPGRIFGIGLLNDWSARDVQAWEYQPLGPFLAKNFASTVSPWVVTAAALRPFRTTAFARAEGDPAPLPYLDDAADRAAGGLDIVITCWLRSAAMRASGLEAVPLSVGNARDLYWTFAQMVAHHTSNGCNLQPGDLLGSGTVSGAARDSRGCLLELTWRGSEPVTLPGGESRAFLEDGDEVTFTARAERTGFVGIGFGACRGVVLPALT